MTVSNKMLSGDVRVVSTRVEEFLKKIKSYARRAEKYGMTAPVATEVRIETEIIALDAAGYAMYNLWHVFNVKHPDLKLDGGWQFLGTVLHMGAENIINVFCSEDEFAELGLDCYRKAKPLCDHCKTTRRRKDTYLVLSTEGEVRQVGKSCLKDYMGRDAALGLGLISSLYGMDDDGYDSYLSPKSRPSYWDPQTIIALSQAVIKRDGWASRGQNPGNGTADKVLDLLLNDRTKNSSSLKASLKKFKAYGIAALKWAQAIDAGNGSSYLQNIRVAVSGQYPMVSFRNVGIVASIPVAYGRYLEDVRRSADKGSSENRAKRAGHIGSIGDKLGMTLTTANRKAGIKSWLPKGKKVTSVSDTRKTALKASGAQVLGLPAEVLAMREFEGFYGLTTLVKLQTLSGHMLTWFKSGSTDDELKPGVQVLVSGTVKKHDTFKEVPQTILNRCTLILDK